MIDLASDSSDDEVGAGGSSERTARQPEQPKRRRILQLPPAPASLGGRPPAQQPPGLQQQSLAFPGTAGQGAPRKPGDRSYLGAYSAADLAEGRFPGGRCWRPDENPAAAVADASEQRCDDGGKGKMAMTKEDDFGGAYGADYYDDDVAAPPGEWDGGGGCSYDGGAQQNDWEDWGDPCGEAGPSHTSPQRR